jgi:hypothetical protein
MAKHIKIKHAKKESWKKTLFFSIKAGLIANIIPFFFWYLLANYPYNLIDFANILHIDKSFILMPLFVLSMLIPAIVSAILGLIKIETGTIGFGIVMFMLTTLYWGGWAVLYKRWGITHKKLFWALAIGSTLLYTIISVFYYMQITI